MKFVYNKYMFCDENLESSKVIVNIWICLLVYLSYLKPFWLLCKICLYFLSIKRIKVSVLVNSLYIVFAKLLDGG